MASRNYITILGQRRVTEMHRFIVFLATLIILVALIFFKVEHDAAIAVCIVFLSAYSTSFWALGIPKTVI